ncbi:MAG: LssY C-terminal domain-containing protein [Pseudomonadota bacterium]|nr:LssY C-terminal domain-containing protein [Pseudomonadota bacterium]
MLDSTSDSECRRPPGEPVRIDPDTAFHAVSLLFLVSVLTLSGCATFEPRPLDDVPFRDRAQTQQRGELSVTVAIPTQEEATGIYGVDLSEREMQPVWIEVKNDSDLPVWFLPSGLDPSYFSAAEAAYPFSSSTSGKKGRVIEDHFHTLQFRNPIQPGTTTSGFLIVNRDEGFKAIDVDILTREDSSSFTFIIVDPAFRGDFTLVDFDTLYSDAEIVAIDDEDALRRAIELLPCCTANEKGTEEGDPLNLVLIGDAQDVFPAFIRRGWHGTEVIWSKAILRTMKSFMSGSRYRYSPVSPLYVYGRRQDLAGQKSRGTIHERNHKRIWLTPIRFRGKAVWVGQISRDIGVKFTTRSPTISTHVIDPDVDEARRYFLEDMAYSQAMARFGFTAGVGEVSRDAPRFNLVGDPWFSDGRRAVMFFEPRPYTLGDLDILDWEALLPSQTMKKKDPIDEDR